MENLLNELNGVFDVEKVAEIFPTIFEAIQLAKKENRPISFSFRGVTMTVTRTSIPSIAYYMYGQTLRQASEEQEKQTRANRNAVYDKLTWAPAFMEFRSVGFKNWEEFKQKCQGPDYIRLVNQAERWCRFLQKKMADGVKLTEKVIENAFHEVNTCGIDFAKFKQSPVFWSLIRCWKYGNFLVCPQ